MNKKIIRNIGIFVFVCTCFILHSIEDSLINLLVISGYISITSGREIIIGVIAAMIYIAVGIRIRAYRRQANSNHKKLLPQIAVLKKVGV